MDFNMEDSYLQTEVKYDFLTYPDTKEYFGELDYALRNGTHIQQQSRPKGVFSYLKKAYPGLVDYYKDLFDLTLSTAGQGEEQFYFIEFEKDPNGQYFRGAIPLNNRCYLKDAYLVVGLLLAHFYGLELTTEYKYSVEGFVRLINEEYEEYQPQLLRLFARNDNEFVTDADQNAVLNVVRKAIEEFDQLGWVELNRDTQEFEILPSCKRLLLLYQDWIDRVDELIKK